MTEPDHSTPDAVGAAGSRTAMALVDAFGISLLLVLAAIVLPAFLPEGAVTSTFVAVLSGAAVLVALRSAHVARWQFAVATAIVLVAVVAVASVEATDSEALEAAAAVAFGLLLVLTPVAVLIRIARHRHITVRTVYGAVLVYVMVGVAFSFMFQALDHLDAAAVVGAQSPNRVEFTYYAFVTLTTTGYGDIVPGTDEARTLAILEALMGQIFLVVIVARVVGMLGQERPPALPLDAET